MFSACQYLRNHRPSLTPYFFRKSKPEVNIVAPEVGNLGMVEREGFKMDLVSRCQSELRMVDRFNAEEMDAVPSEFDFLNLPVEWEMVMMNNDIGDLTGEELIEHLLLTPDAGRPPTSSVADDDCSRASHDALPMTSQRSQNVEINGLVPIDDDLNYDVTNYPRPIHDDSNYDIRNDLVPNDHDSTYDVRYDLFPIDHNSTDDVKDDLLPIDYDFTYDVKNDLLSIEDDSTYDVKNDLLPIEDDSTYDVKNDLLPIEDESTYDVKNDLLLSYDDSTYDVMNDVMPLNDELTNQITNDQHQMPLDDDLTRDVTNDQMPLNDDLTHDVNNNTMPLDNATRG